MVTLDTTRNRGGWIRAKLLDKAAPSTNDVAINIASNPCPDCPYGVGGVNGITTEYPATLIANAPSAPGTYTWSAAWYGNPGGSSYGSHRDVYAQFTFNVVAPDVNKPPIADAGSSRYASEPATFGNGALDGTVTLDVTVPDDSWILVTGSNADGEGVLGPNTFAAERSQTGTWILCGAHP